jgi:hypothetical protein
MRTGHAVNLYLSDVTLKKLDAICKHNTGTKDHHIPSKSEMVGYLVDEYFLLHGTFLDKYFKEEK